MESTDEVGYRTGRVRPLQTIPELPFPKDLSFRLERVCPTVWVVLRREDECKVHTRVRA